MKRLLSDLERDHPRIRASIFAAMGNVMAAHLLDARLYPRDIETGADPWIDADDAEIALATLPQRIPAFDQ